MRARQLKQPAVLVAAVMLVTVAGVTSGDAIERPAVVELYTSEGCSSCPPAEQLLEELSRRSDVIAIAMHVDYWDNSEWRDRFSLSEATVRQKAMAQALGLASLVTPQMIIDGRRSIVGTSREDVLAALREPRLARPVEALLHDGNVLVRVPQSPAHDAYEVYVISYLPKAVTAVAQGENAGRTLTEFNVVRSIRRLGTIASSTRQWTLAGSSFPKDASRALVLLQRPGHGAVAGAVVVDLR